MEDEAPARLERFRASLAGGGPPAGADLAVQGLWWAARGEWERAHGCVQQREGDPGCDWVHAFLHRQEGDMDNARYWYRRAGRDAASGGLEEEWAAVAGALLARG